jgi:VWFA-related protein
VIRRQAMIVLSDGRDTASHMAFERAMAETLRSGATVYTIAPQNIETGNPDKDGGKATRQAEYYLRTLARDTGGRAFIISDAATLPALYATVAAELQHQYTLAFRPAPTGGQAAPRQLDVRLASRPGAIVRTRRSYEP